MTIRKLARSSAVAATALLAGAAGLTGCDQLDVFGWFDDDSGGGALFIPFGTSVSAAFGTPIVTRGNLGMYLASEATTGAAGRDLNGDGDTADQVAVLVSGSAQSTIPVATESFQLTRFAAYLVVDEDKDGRDWNFDGQTDDLVLLVSAGGAASFVSVLDVATASQSFATEDRFYFKNVPVGGLMPGETDLLYTTAFTPGFPQRLLSADATNTLEPTVFASDEGLAFLAQDEGTEGRDLNGDGDLNDGVVVALLEERDPTAMVVNTGLAVSNTGTPVRAMSRGAGDWLVGLLVSEARQGGTNFNTPGAIDLGAGWQPSQCSGLGDGDTGDDVLHFLEYAAFVADPVTNPPRNTGLVGVNRIFAVPGAAGSPGYVGTLSDEQDEGNCSLNRDPGNGNDTDQVDQVLRWTEAVAPVVPFGDVDELVALAAVNGGTFGATEFDGRFVAVVDEAADSRNHDAVPAVNNLLLAWLDPRDGAAAAWTYSHSVPGAGFVGTDYMTASRSGDRLLATIDENVTGFSLNAGDPDIADVVPAFARFDPFQPSGDLDFPGPAVAAVTGDALLRMVNRSAVYQVNENEDRKDWNEDGDRNDVVLVRTSVDVPSSTVFVITVISTDASNTNTFTVVPRIEFTDSGVLLLTNEGPFGEDINFDGDLSDFVMQFVSL